MGGCPAWGEVAVPLPDVALLGHAFAAASAAGPPAAMHAPALRSMPRLTACLSVCPSCLCPQVKEVPPAAAAWADEFGQQRQQQREQQGPAVWGDEFASFQAQQHPAATGEQWAEDFATGGHPLFRAGGRAARLRGLAWQAVLENRPAFSPHPSLCANTPPAAGPAGGADWADQFAEGMLGGGAWAEEFGAQASTGARWLCAWAWLG